MTLLIIGDPKGTASITALRIYPPEDIWVWENDPRHIYTINQIDGRINVITVIEELIAKGMKFDVIIANPPYQSGKKNGECSGSGGDPLYIKFIRQSAELLKPEGIVSFINPTNAFTGSEVKTRYLVGPDALYDVSYIDLDVSNHFNIGQDVCRWTGKLASSKDTVTKLSDGREVNLKKIDYLVEDCELDGIVKTLSEYQAPRLQLTNKGAYNYRSVENILKKQGVENAKELSRDRSEEKTEEYIYPVDFNGKDYYVKVKPKSYESPRIFVPQLTNPERFKFYAAENKGANGSTYVAEFDSIEEAQSVCDILNTPVYLWIVKNLRIDGRLRKTHLESLPLVDIEQVLSSEQLAYIQSKL